MVFLIAGVLTLGVLYLVAQAIAGADPRALVRGIRYGVGGVFVAAGILMCVVERWGLGIPLIGIGASVMATGRIGPIDLGGGGVRRAGGSRSTVTTDWLEMELDHDSGAMSGRVKRGDYAGRTLDSMGEADLRQLVTAIGRGNDSTALLEAYLDRRFPGRSEDVEGDGDARTGSAANAGAMTDQEAYQVLGLLPGATEAEIRAAHRRLMKAVHPDQGGSTFLAAKINQAKDRLLNNHR